MEQTQESSRTESSYEAKDIQVLLGLSAVRKKLIEIIRPFIPDCMKYKIGE